MENLSPNDEIILTIAEHHANFVPWQYIAGIKKANIKVAYFDPDKDFDINIIKSLISDKESSIYYQPLENDPFDYSISEGLYDENQLLDLTYETNYPDAIIQLLQIFRSKRCGDLVLSANPGWDFRKKFEIPLHKSSHGSLRKEHMIVPLILNKKIKCRILLYQTEKN